MAVFHDGKEAAILPDKMHPDAIDFIWFTWKGKLNGATMTGSVWGLPTGFTEVNSAQDVTVTVGGVVYENVNWVLLSTTEVDGDHLIQNIMSADNGMTDIKGGILTVDPSI